MDFPWGRRSTPGRAVAMRAAGCRFGLAGVAGQDVAQQRADGRAQIVSKPVTSTNATTLRSISGQSACLSGRKPRVRLPHEAPDQIAEIAQQVARRVEGACVGGSKPSLGTKHQNPVSSVGFQSAGRRSRRSHVRFVHGVPTSPGWRNRQSSGLQSQRLAARSRGPVPDIST